MEGEEWEGRGEADPKSFVHKDNFCFEPWSDESFAPRWRISGFPSWMVRHRHKKTATDYAPNEKWGEKGKETLPALPKRTLYIWRQMLEPPWRDRDRQTSDNGHTT
jgi:hypothetical protein